MEDDTIPLANATAAIDFNCISGLLWVLMSLRDEPMKRDTADIGRTNPRKSRNTASGRLDGASGGRAGSCARSDCASRSADASGRSANGRRRVTRRVPCP
jgi:hypothetical protein